MVYGVWWLLPITRIVLQSTAVDWRNVQLSVMVFPHCFLCGFLFSSAVAVTFQLAYCAVFSNCGNVYKAFACLVT